MYFIVRVDVEKGRPAATVTEIIVIVGKTGKENIFTVMVMVVIKNLKI